MEVKGAAALWVATHMLALNQLAQLSEVIKNAGMVLRRG